METATMPPPRKSKLSGPQVVWIKGVQYTLRQFACHRWEANLGIITESHVGQPCGKAHSKRQLIADLTADLTAMQSQVNS